MADPDGTGSPTAESGDSGSWDPDAGDPGLESLAGPLAAFHAAVFVAVPVLALHLSGSVGDLLAGLSTTVGMGAYLLLWGLCWLTARQWLRGFPAGGWAASHAGSRIGRAAVWGAATGVGFLWIALVVFLVERAVVAGVSGFTPAFAVLFLSIGFGLGGAVAATVGLLVGAILGAVDYAAFAIAGGIVAGETAGVPRGDRTTATDAPGDTDGSTE